MHRTIVAALSTLALAAGLGRGAPAAAYETDQLTGRESPLVDVVELANAEMDRLLDVAVARVARLGLCRADDERLHRVLAREIRAVTASRRWAWSRGFWRAPGFGVYSKWMEVDPRLDRHAFAEREDFYGGLRLFQAPILAVAGPCSTFELAGVRLGSDKMDHFLAEGFVTWRKSDFGADPERAAFVSTRTENTIYGLSTSRVFSYADLRANWDGFRFYGSLLQPGSVIERGEDGCPRRVRSFDWAEWVDWQYDEVLNPSVYMPDLGERVRATLEERSESYCETLPEWAPEGWSALRDAYSLRGDEPWIGPGAPPQSDPYGFDRLCEPDEPDSAAAHAPTGG